MFNNKRLNSLSFSLSPLDKNKQETGAKTQEQGQKKTTLPLHTNLLSILLPFSPFHFNIYIAMDTVKPKRFSFSGFSTSLSRSLSFNSKPKDTSLPTPPPEEQQATTAEELEEQRRNRRAQKSKSLYVKSFRKSVQSDSSVNKSFDASEATQTNSKEVRSAIRRSLSAVLYASPHSSSSSRSETTSKLVPILVTPGLSDSVGGILIDDGSTPLSKTIEVAAVTAETTKKKPVEYDNRLEVFCNKKNDAVTILWQGYGYTVDDDKKEVASEMLVVDKTEETPQDLEARFEKDVWESYCGLVHPLHLFLEKEQDAVLDRGRWAGLSVTELRRYYDNYGSMMLKIRENRMIKQQGQYHCRSDVKKEWIIIPEGETDNDKQQQEELSDI